MKRLLFSLGVGLAFWLGIAGVHAETLVAWDFVSTAANAPSAPASTTATGMAAGSTVTRGSGLGASGYIDSGQQFGSRFWGSAFDANDYVTFTIAPDDGMIMSLQQITMSLFEQNSPVMKMELQWATDPADFGAGNSNSSGAFTVSGSNTGYAIYNVDLSGAAVLQQTTEAWEFRLYGWEQGHWEAAGFRTSGGNNALEVNGTVEEEPPPPGTIVIIR